MSATSPKSKFSDDGRFERVADTGAILLYFFKQYKRGAGMSTSTAISYVHGAVDTPLLGETIGQNLDRTAARFPDVEALVVPSQHVRWTYRELV